MIKSNFLLAETRKISGLGHIYRLLRSRLPREDFFASVARLSMLSIKCTKLLMAVKIFGKKY